MADVSKERRDEILADPRVQATVQRDRAIAEEKAKSADDVEEEPAPVVATAAAAAQE